jgi:ParB family transcriptional regulator, chromosome partitioning protein
MAIKKRGLGRGLDALLGTGAAELPLDHGEAKAREELRRLPVEQVRPGKYQPRLDMCPTALEELADSIRAQGVVQPVVVRPAEGGVFELIAGERRWRAAQMAGLDEIPAVVRDVPDQAAVAIALIENIQREDLNPIEEATALQRLINEFGMTHQEVSQAVGRSRPAVSNLLRLLTLEGEARHLVETGALEMGHARALLGLSGETQQKAAQLVAKQGLSVRETERLVQRWQQGGSVERAKKTPPLDPDIQRLQEDLAERLGAVVHLQHTPGGGGKLLIKYHSIDELDGILAHIK